MGLILSIFESNDASDVFLDFENTRPTEAEINVYERIDELLKKGQQVMQRLEEYKGCQELCRKAMATPTPDNEKAAFEGLLLAVDAIASFFYFAKDIENNLPPLLEALCKTGAAANNDDSKQQQQQYQQSLQSQQALAKQLALLFDFSLSFDSLRMQRPYISNDFSYYRRLLPKYSKHPDLKIKDDEASGMALFTAEHIPMLNALIRATTTAINNKVKMNNSSSSYYGGGGEGQKQVCMCLATMSNVCYSMIKNKKLVNEKNLLLCARACVGALILFDHVDDMGCFHKRQQTLTNMKNIVSTLKKELAAQNKQADLQMLLNSLQFSSKHFRDASAQVQELFN